MFTDNGPQFVCREFKEFEREWEFQHSTSSPLHPQSNGKVENSVKTCKLLMKKALLSKGDVHLALLEFRNTPSERDGVSLSQKLFSRRTRARLPTTKELLKPRVVDTDKVMAGAERAKLKQKENYDVKAHSLTPLEAGEFVRLKLPGKQTWSLAKCIKQVGPRSYEVICGERIYRRNRRDLRKSVETLPETQFKYQYSGIQKADTRKRVSKFSEESPKEELVLRRSTRERKSPDRYQAG